MPLDVHAAHRTELHGFRNCTCGAYVMEVEWHQFGGLCFDCFVANRTRNLRVVEVIHAGRRSNLPTARAPKRGSRGRNRNHAVRKSAKLAAQRRLADLYPEMFAMLYAEERVRRGLPPVPLRTYEPVAAKGAATYEMDPVYSALLEQGVTPDGAS